MLRTKQYKDNGLRRTFRRLAAFSVAIGTVIAPVKVNWNIFKDRSFISSSDAMANSVTTLSKEQKAAKDVHAKLLGYISGSDPATRTEALRLYNDALDDRTINHTTFEQNLLAEINSNYNSAGLYRELATTLEDPNLGFKLFLEGIEAQILSASVLDKLEAYVERKEGDKAGIVSAYTDARNFGGSYSDFDKVLMAELQKRPNLRRLYGSLHQSIPVPSGLVGLARSAPPAFTDFVDALVLARDDQNLSATRHGQQFTDLVSGSFLPRITLTVGNADDALKLAEKDIGKLFKLGEGKRALDELVVLVDTFHSNPVFANNIDDILKANPGVAAAWKAFFSDHNNASKSTKDFLIAFGLVYHDILEPKSDSTTAMLRATYGSEFYKRVHLSMEQNSDLKKYTSHSAELRTAFAKYNQTIEQVEGAISSLEEDVSFDVSLEKGV